MKLRYASQVDAVRSAGDELLQAIASASAVGSADLSQQVLMIASSVTTPRILYWFRTRRNAGEVHNRYCIASFCLSLPMLRCRMC